MKRFLTIAAALALVLGLSQCKKMRPDMPQYSGPVGDMYVQQATLKASQHENNSKVADDGLGCVKWELDDVITVSGGGEGTLTCKEVNGKDGVFTGKITKKSEEGLTFTYGDFSNYFNQTGKLTEALHLVGTSNFEESGEYNVDMSIDYAVLKLDLSAFGTATPGTVAISAGGSEVASVTGVTNAANNPYYVAMPAAASSEYTFSGGGKTGKATWALAANTFYTKSGSSTGEAIVVATTPKFSVSADKTVEFSKGNLWYGTASSKDAPAFHFEANQWDFQSSYSSTWADNNHISHFFWDKTAGVAYAGYYDTHDVPAAVDDVFFANASLSVDGENGWFTLTDGEWKYLLGIGESYRVNAKSLRKFVTLTVSGKGEVKGLVILPDGDAAIPDTINEAYLTSNNAVFLPAAGFRSNGTDVSKVGSDCYYWSRTPHATMKFYAYNIYFRSGSVGTDSSHRANGICVRLVR